MPEATLARYEMTEREFESISRMVTGLCGINLHTGKRELVKARLSKRLRLLGLSSYAEYMRHVEEDPTGRELANMIDALSTNVTSFFRESSHMETLGHTLLPRLMADRNRSHERRLRLWSAGCSSGEEPYSIGIVLLETMPDIDQWDVRILATDISNQVLQKARRAEYEEVRFKHLPAGLRQKYFERVGGGPTKVYRACERLRSMVSFARLNLMEPWPMSGPFDFIFCRNVMIYFDKPTQQRLVERFSSLLGRSGVLFIGHSESLSGVRHDLHQLYPTVYRN